MESTNSNKPDKSEHEPRWMKETKEFERRAGYITKQIEENIKVNSQRPVRSKTARFARDHKYAIIINDPSLLFS